jgi:hypothetical protein
VPHLYILRQDCYFIITFSSEFVNR